LCVSFVSAEDITIKTLQYHWVEVTVGNGMITDFVKLEYHEGDADEYGDFVFNLDTTIPKVNLYITIKKDGKMGDAIFSNKKFLGEETDEPIYIELIPEGKELIVTPENVPEVNESLNETLTEEGLDAENVDSKITGYAVGDFFKSKAFYIVLGVLVVLIIVLILVKIIRKRRANKNDREVKIKKLGEMKQERDEKIDDHKQIIEDAERKIREAQEEISLLKNQDKIKEMEKKISDDESELIKLRRGN